MALESRQDEQSGNRSIFFRNLGFPYALFSLPRTLGEYRSAGMAFSISSLILIFLAMLLWFRTRDYALLPCLSLFALFAAISLIRMAWLRQIDSEIGRL